MRKNYSFGFDVGTEFVNSAVMDESEKIVLAGEPRMHFGNPSGALVSLLEEMDSQGLRAEEGVVAFTGDGGKTLARVTNSQFFYDTISIPLGANFLDSSARYVFHIGARDPYFFETDTIDVNGEKRFFVADHETGTKCGGGSGILITKQCRRLFDSGISSDVNFQKRLEQMYEKACKMAQRADKEIDVGGRCGVVIQSDMIHLQNSGERIENILHGMFDRVAKNFQSDVVRVRTLNHGEYGLATGGVFGSFLLVGMLEKHLGVGVKRPEHYQHVGAIGVALKAKTSSSQGRFDRRELENVLEMEKQKIQYAPPLSSALHKLTMYDEFSDSERVGDITVFSKPGSGRVPVVLGVDGGSTTTKILIAKAGTLEPIAESCVSTHGRPLEAIQGIFRQLRDVLGDRIDIKSVAYTGSSGAFYHRLFSAPSNNGSPLDIVKDEITCHALGVKRYRGDVDTICELGGQDAKFTVFDGDNVRDSKMNLSCMAGTGQTMENMMRMVGIENYSEFERLALSAKRTPVVDDTCGVFTEAGIARLASLGLPTDELAAGIVHACIGGYVHKFVGNERFGDCISAQGGPYNSKACLAALALHTGLKINAFPHRQLFGAYGAAIAANEVLNGELNGET